MGGHRALPCPASAWSDRYGAVHVQRRRCAHGARSVHARGQARAPHLPLLRGAAPLPRRSTRHAPALLHLRGIANTEVYLCIMHGEAGWFGVVAVVQARRAGLGGDRPKRRGHPARPAPPRQASRSVHIRPPLSAALYLLAGLRPLPAALLGAACRAAAQDAPRARGDAGCTEPHRAGRFRGCFRSALRRAVLGVMMKHCRRPAGNEWRTNLIFHRVPRHGTADPESWRENKVERQSTLIN